MMSEETKNENVTSTASPTVQEPTYHRKYGSRTSALEVVKDVDLTGKTILITGTTAGIGTETARTLALRGAHVVMANRNIVLSEQLRDNIYKETDKRTIDILHMDLSSLQSVQAAVKEFLSKGWPLHVLILNAGVLGSTTKNTIDGYETTFGTNHLSHFYLTYLLLEKLRESAPSRVVVVSSNSHNHTGIPLTATTDAKLARLIPDPNTREIAYKLYAYSKLCNVLFAFKLHREENKNGINTYVLHPGSMIATSTEKMDSDEGGIVVDYHACEFFPERWFDLVIVLRCDNTILFDRLTERNYPEKKVRENVECEIFGTILDEAKESYSQELVHEFSNENHDQMAENVRKITELALQIKKKKK